MIVKDIMSVALVTLERHEALVLAEEIMTIGRLRHLPVVEGNKLVGLVTHRDILRAQAQSGGQKGGPIALPVDELMTKDVLTVTPETPLIEAAKLLHQRKIGCLPVVAPDGALIGIITEADFLEVIIDALGDSSQDA